MKMRLIEFDGTPAEFELVKHQFGVNSGSLEPNESETARPAETPPQSAQLSPAERHEVVVSALTRIPLPPTMRKVFEALLKSPNGTTTAEFAKLLGITRAQLAGVFGAFGRRLSHTEGFPEDDADAWLATNSWNGSERRYVLTPLGRAALKDKRVVLA
jgi:hypothetical protein